MADKTTNVAVTITAKTGDSGQKVGDLKKDIAGVGSAAKKSSGEVSDSMGKIGDSLGSVSLQQLNAQRMALKDLILS